MGWERVCVTEKGSGVSVDMCLSVITSKLVSVMPLLSFSRVVQNVTLDINTMVP